MPIGWPLEPMKGVAGDLPRGPDWAYEPKWDGHRALVRLAGGEVDVRSSSGIRRVEHWPWIVEATHEAVGGRSADLVLDGEVVAMDDDGRHSFQSVGRSDRPHALVVFDLLVLDGSSLLGHPWHERRALLEATVRPCTGVLVTPQSTDADAMWDATRSQGFEGVMAKRRDSTYQPGKRSPSWRKAKHRRQQEFVVGGYLLGEGSRASTFGSLVVGVHEDGALRHAGSVGSGLDDNTIRALLPQLQANETMTSPFEPEPRFSKAKARVRWVRPEIVVQVAFAEWTADGHLRHPVFLGVRDDVDPGAVVREP